MNQKISWIGPVLLALLLIVTGCDEDTLSPNLPSVLSAVEGGGGNAEVGSTRTLVVQVSDLSGDGMPDIPVEWQVVEGDGSLSSSSARTSAEGLASTTWTLDTLAGPQVVRASVQGLSSVSFQVTATPGELVGIRALPDSVLFQANREEEQLEASGVDRYGNATGSLEIAWESHDETVARVSESGLATSTGNGETIIVATSGTFTDTVAVVVRTPEPLATIEITSEQDTILVESGVQLSAAGIDEADGPYVLGLIEWASSDETTAVIDEDGYVRSIAGGQRRSEPAPRGSSVSTYSPSVGGFTTRISARIPSG